MIAEVLEDLAQRIAGILGPVRAEATDFGIRSNQIANGRRRFAGIGQPRSRDCPYSPSGSGGMLRKSDDRGLCLPSQAGRLDRSDTEVDLQTGFDSVVNELANDSSRARPSDRWSAGERRRSQHTGPRSEQWW